MYKSFLGLADWYSVGVGDDTQLVYWSRPFKFVARESIVGGVYVEEEASYDFG